MTRQRELILNIIQSSDNHPTAEDIFRAAKKVMPSIAYGTVYRNLSLMLDAGEIRLVEVTDASNRYDKNTAPHDHVICPVCGAVSDVFWGDLTPLFKEKSGLDIISYELNLRALCENCRDDADSK